MVVTLQDMADVEELERMRAEFLAMVSHEFRMPLTSIMGSATAIMDSGTDLDPAVVTAVRCRWRSPPVRPPSSSESRPAARLGA